MPLITYANQFYDIASAGGYTAQDGSVYTLDGAGTLSRTITESMLIQGTASWSTGMSNVTTTSIVGNIPPWLLKGTDAHSTFTTYMRIMHGGERAWNFNLAIGGGPNPLDRPDAWYDNNIIGGVWELKPGAPSPSAPKADIEALAYAGQLNAARGTTRFMPGSSNGAPPPFTGVLTLPSSSTGNIYEYSMGSPNSGAIYYKDVTPKREPSIVLDPTRVREREHIQFPNWKHPVAPWKVTAAVIGVGILWEGSRLFFPARNLIPAP